MATQTTAAAQPQQTALQKAQTQNANARAYLLKNSIDAWQVTSVATYTGGAGQNIQIPLKNVGLQKRITIEVAAAVTASANGEVNSLTPQGGACFFSNVTLTDLSNYIRINTPSWHLTHVASAKYKQPYGSAIRTSAVDTPFNYGANYVNTQTAPLTVTTASNTTNNVFLMFEVPLAYSDKDLRGALFAQVTSGTYTLSLTVNPSLFVLSGSDNSFAMYQSNSNTAGHLGSLYSATITINQNYLDQLPFVGGGYVLPQIDISTMYIFNQSQLGGLVNNAPNPIAYPNQRAILSTTFVYDDNNTIAAGKLSAIQIQTANTTNLISIDQNVMSLWNRNRMQADFPPGVYYIDHRKRPIQTIQFGNESLVLTPSTVTGASSAIYYGLEMLAQINSVVLAGSLAGT